jgi:hypothetical protein
MRAGRVLGFLRQHWIDTAVITFFCYYSIHVLSLAKLFHLTVGPEWYRDLGLAWYLGDATVSHDYPIGSYFQPPAHAILFHLYGLLNRDIAFRLYLIAEVCAVWITVWAWCRIGGIRTKQNAMLVPLLGFLAASRYVHSELAFHNQNALVLMLLSLALLFERRPIFAGGCYAVSVAIKPYSNVFIMPWMIWRGEYRWVAAAFCWLMFWFAILPAYWFGVDRSLQIYGSEIVSIWDAATLGNQANLSVLGGLAALTGRSSLDPIVRAGSFALQGFWLAAWASYFIPTLKDARHCRGIAAACDYAAILLIALPLGRYMQPPREIALLAGTLLLAVGVFDDRLSVPRRFTLTCILVAIGLSSWAVPLGPLSCLLAIPICFAALGGLWILRAASIEDVVRCEGKPAQSTDEMVSTGI